MNVPAQIDKRKLESVAKRLHALATRSWTLMELCGGQTSSYLEHELDRLLPHNIKIVHGPGCAICTAPRTLIDTAVAIAQMENVIFCAPGDLLSLKGSLCDLIEVKAQGADVRVVHSPLDCLNIAREAPGKKVVFFSIGFEMTAQLNALSVWQAKRQGLKNYSLLSCHSYVPAFLRRILSEPNTPVQAIIGLGNICSVTGFQDYELLSKRFQTPFVVTGHEPLHFFEGIESCLHMLETNKHAVDNQFRGVTRMGDREAKSLIAEIFELVDREWRGVGMLEQGGYQLRPEFQEHDAHRVFSVDVALKEDSSACICREVILGFKKPTECPLFGRSCRPDSPLGATMVSNDGTCATYFNHLHNTIESSDRKRLV